MAEGIELATAYINLVPSLGGGGRKITTDLGAAGEQGGNRAGGLFRKKFATGSQGAASDTENRFGKTFKKMAIGLGSVFAAKKGVDFLAGTANTYKSVVGDAVKLRRFVGGSVEEASKLRFVGQQSGIGVDKLTRSFGLFNKQLVAGKLDKFIGQTKDANGKLLPMSTLLPKIAEKFKGMEEGPAKTALAMKLFGRSGAELVPLLNKGAGGIDELMKKADDMGVVLGDKDVTAMAESNKASRLWKAGLESVQLQIGRYVLPVMTKFVGYLASKMPGVIKAVAAGAKKMSEAFAPFIAKVGPAVRKVERYFAPLVERIKAFFKGDPQARFAALAAVFGGVVLSAVVAVGTALASFLSPVYLVIGALALVAFGALYAYKHFEGFRRVVDSVAKWLVGTAWPAIKAFAAGVAQAIRSGVETARRLWARWGDDLKQVASIVWSYISTTIRNGLTIVRGIIETVTGLIHGDWGKVWDGIKTVFSGVIGQVQNIARTGLDLLGRIWSFAWGWIKDKAAEILGASVKWISGKVDEVIGFFTGMPKRAAGAFVGLFDGMGTAFAKVLNWIIDKWNGLDFKLPSLLGGGTIGLPDIDHVNWGGSTSAPDVKPGSGSPKTVVGGQHAPEAQLSSAATANRRAGVGATTRAITIVSPPDTDAMVRAAGWALRG